MKSSANHLYLAFDFTSMDILKVSYCIFINLRACEEDNSGDLAFHMPNSCYLQSVSFRSRLKYYNVFQLLWLFSNQDEVNCCQVTANPICFFNSNGCFAIHLQKCWRREGVCVGGYRETVYILRREDYTNSSYSNCSKVIVKGPYTLSLLKVKRCYFEDFVYIKRKSKILWI